MLKIDVLTNDGSPLKVTHATLMGEDKYQIGVGGAELALLTLCELWAKRGDRVRLYNNPRERGRSPFDQYDLGEFVHDDDRDILIVFRSPNSRVYGASGLKIWFSTDQYTIGNFKEFAPAVDKIVTISPFHADYFRSTYGIENTITIDLPVRTWEYEQNVPKVPHRCIFTSVPDRGLGSLMLMWPHILAAVPGASLVITSDYRLWGAPFAGNERFMEQLMRLPNVTMLGAVKRPRLVEEQLKAEFLLYPACYEELFCYAVAEAECAGAFPITTSIGALYSTNMGHVTSKDDFVNSAIVDLSAQMPGAYRWAFRKEAINRFGPERILAEWDKVFAL